MSTKSSIKSTSQLIHTILVFFFMFGFRFVVPEFGQVTEIGIQVLGVFIGCVWGWVFTDSIGWPSVLGIVALGMTDYISMADLFAAGFASQTAVMLMGLFLLTAFVSAEGLGEVIVNFLLTRNFNNGRPYVILFSFMLAAFITGVLSDCMVAVVLFIELFRTMFKNTGIPLKSKATSVFLVGLSFSSVISTVALPVKSAAIMYTGTLVAINGYVYNPIAIAVFMTGASIFSFIVYALFCKFVLRIDLSMLQEIGDLPGLHEPVTKRKKYALTAVIVVTVALMLPTVLPKAWTITAILNNMGFGGMTLFFLACLCVIKVDGESLLNFKNVARSFSWDSFFMIVILFPIAKALTNDVCGIKDTLGAWIIGIADGLPMYVLICFLLAACAIITNFANNVVIGALFITIVGTMQATAFPELNVSTLVACIMIVCNSSVFFPAAGPANAVCFAQTDLIDFKTELKIGLWFTLIAIVLSCTIFYALGLLMF